MKLFKKITVLSMAALMTGALASCDYLDVQPENSVPQSDVDYTNTEQMYQPVSGCYASIRTGGCHWVINFLSVIRDGDVWSGRVDDQGDLVNMGEHYAYINSWWGINEMWNQYYNMIKVCNGALTSLDLYAEHITNEADKATYRSYRAEVLTIRAYAYYRLTEYFGDVTILNTNEQSDMRRSVRDVVYQYCLRDLETAAKDGQKLNPNAMVHPGAVTAYTAEMLAAKMYLNMGNWQKAKELTDDIIGSGQFDLYPDYYQLWKIPGKLCCESLLEAQVTDFGMSDANNYVGVDQYFNSASPTVSNENTALTQIGGWNFVGYLDSFYDWAIARGETIRANTSFLVGGTTTPSGDYVQPAGNPSNTNCWNGKWYLPLDQYTEGLTNMAGQNNNVRILRFAEVLLINAEAKVRLGQNGDKPFNRVRTRAQMPTITGVTVDQILDERRMELCCEWGTRYEDLIRTGLAKTVLGPKGWDESKTYYPVPLGQLDLAPALRLDPYTELIF